MSDVSQIRNDSIVFNDVMSDRLNAKRLDLLDTEFYGKVTFIFEKGMVKDIEIQKKRRVKR